MLTLIANLVAAILRRMERPKAVYYQDRHGHWLHLPTDLYTAAGLADAIDAASSNPAEEVGFWLTPEGLRQVIAIAQAEPNPDIAVLTVFANIPEATPEDLGEDPDSL